MNFLYKRFFNILIIGCGYFFGIHVMYGQTSNDLFLQTSEVNHLMINFDADRGSLTRFYTVTNSPERTQRLIEFYQSYLNQLEAVAFDKMSQGGKVDYVLFSRRLQRDLLELKNTETEYESTKKHFPFANDIYEMEKLRRRGTPVQGDQIAAKLEGINKRITIASQTLKSEEPLPAYLSKSAVATVNGLINALKSVYTFYYDYDPGFTWWAEKPYPITDSLLKAYAVQLNKKSLVTQKDDGSNIIGNPIGDAELRKQLTHEMIPYSPEELIEMANKEFAWCDVEILKASKEMGFDKDWKAALEKVKNTFVAPGLQPKVILGLHNEAIDFLQKHDLITIPPIANETWRMGMMSPQRQLINPFFTGGEQISISYPTGTMSQEDKLMSMRGNNPHFSKATVHHELIAGHHLQQFMNNRYKAYRNFNTPFWTEGWALYWEMILWDLNFPKGPEDKVGFLFWRMHRCARIIFSLNYHLGKWSPQQCIDFLVDRVGHERSNAEGEVRRSFTGNYGPLYQLAYMMGALQFYSLKKELVDSKKMTLKQFHDAIIRENNMPVEMVRAILTNQNLKKNFETNWRFYWK